jgi:hypothetical protein
MWLEYAMPAKFVLICLPTLNTLPSQTLRSVLALSFGFPFKVCPLFAFGIPTGF